MEVKKTTWAEERKEEEERVGPKKSERERMRGMI